MINAAAVDELLSRLLPLIHAHLEPSPATPAPFVLAISGLQGSGKSTWAAALCRALTQTHAIAAAAVSLDDFYHTHEKLVEIREASPGNALLRTRGQPGTHDERLAAEFFSKLASGSGSGGKGEGEGEVRMPRFDKARFNGEGDRLPPEEWDVIPAKPRLQVVVFEGWCLGFRPLDEASIRARHAAAFASASASASASAKRPPDLSSEAYPTNNTLAQHSVAHLLALNANLKRYVTTFMGPRDFDAMVHLSTDSLANVYTWRVGQEHALVDATGTGMGDDEVVRFVKGYMPAYELYLPGLSNECFFGGEGGEGQGHRRRKVHLRVVLGVERNVLGIEEVQRS